MESMIRYTWKHNREPTSMSVADSQAEAPIGKCGGDSMSTVIPLKNFETTRSMPKKHSSKHTN